MRLCAMRGRIHVFLALALALTAGCGPGTEDAPKKRRPRARAAQEQARPAPKKSERGWHLPGPGAGSYGAAQAPGELSRLAAGEAEAVLGRPVTPDASLEEAARALAAEVRRGCKRWPRWMEEPVLFHAGWTDGNTAAVRLCASHASRPAFLSRVAESIRKFPQTTHLGAARVSADWIASVWVLLVDERQARVASFPRRLALGEKAWFAFALDRGLSKPRVYHMDAAGKVRQLEVWRGKKRREYAAQFSSDEPARHWLELMADGEAGPTVLTLFPVHVGMPLPEAVEREPELDLRAQTPVEAERIMLELVNRERSRRGIAPMRMDESLARVARRYSIQQKATGRVAHLAADGSGPGERAAAAGYAARLLAENLAKEEGVLQAHEGLMGSPAHRSAMLDPRFTHAGIGVAIAQEGGGRAFYVTEMFAVPQRSLSRYQVRQEVVEKLRRLRADLGVSSALEDPALNGVARRMLGSKGGRPSLRRALHGERVYGKVSAGRQEVSDPDEAVLSEELSREGCLTYGLAVAVRPGERGLKTYAVSMVFVYRQQKRGGLGWKTDPGRRRDAGRRTRQGNRRRAR